MNRSDKCKPRCHAPWQQMIVDASGTVHPCSFWGTYSNLHNVKSFGNLNAQSLDEIWNNNAYQHLRHEMACGNLEAAGCANCYALKQGLTLELDYDADCENEPGPQFTSYRSNIDTLKVEIAAGATVLEAKPTIVSYTPSHKCNLRCIQCYQEGTRTAAIARNSADADIRHLSPYLVRIIAGGGEPFLLGIWKDFLQSFDVLENPYLDFGVTTNGTLISDNVLEGLERFKSLTINISVDATGKTLELVRQGLSWPVLVGNIRKLKKLVSKKGGRSSIGVTACVQKSTILDLPNFVRFCIAEGLNFGLSPVITMPPDQSLLSFNSHPQEEMRGWKEALNEARDIWVEYMSRKYLQGHEGGDEANIYDTASMFNEIPRSVRNSWAQVFDSVENEIDWSAVEQPCVQVAVEIAPALWDKLRSSDVSKSLWGDEEPIAYIFLKGKPRNNAPYWAPIDDNGRFSVWLPEGAYVANLSTKWLNAEYREVITFEFHGKQAPKMVQEIVARKGSSQLLLRIVRKLGRIFAKSDVVKLS